MTIPITWTQLDAIARVLNAHGGVIHGEAFLASANPLRASDWFRLGILSADEPFATVAEQVTACCVAIGTDAAGNRLYHLKGMKVDRHG